MHKHKVAQWGERPVRNLFLSPPPQQKSNSRLDYFTTPRAYGDKSAKSYAGGASYTKLGTEIHP